MINCAICKTTKVLKVHRTRQMYIKVNHKNKKKFNTNQKNQDSR